MTYSTTYNTPVRFDGDIIITDPCYIIREGADKQLVRELAFEKVEKPEIEDFYSVIDGTSGYANPEKYPDCLMLPLDDPRISPYTAESRRESYKTIKAMIEALGDGHRKELDEILESYQKAPYSETYNMETSAYHQALWRYEENNPRDDWEYCEYGDSMENIGLTAFCCGSTIYGDWSCHTFDTDKNEVLGRFCADSGQVAVFLLDEVLKYNPEFDYHINRLWTTTLIRDFHGTVELHLKEDESGGSEVTVVGRGNINFVSRQTGF